MCAREGASRCGTLCSEKVLEREVWLDTVVSRDRATLKSASSLPFSSLSLRCRGSPSPRAAGARGVRRGETETVAEKAPWRPPPAPR